MTSTININYETVGHLDVEESSENEKDRTPRFHQEFLNDSGWNHDPLDENQPTYQPGEKIGDRVVIKELGRGGMGVVYLTERRKQNFTCKEALKVSLNLSEPLRFQREVKLLSELNHPSICKIIDVGVTKNNDPYFVMEHIDGIPVTDFCQKEIKSIAKALMLFVNICEAIDYIHSKSIIHRDIKPSNILALKRGGIRVLDFGIAKFLHKQNETFNTGISSPFTPAYASPEQRNPNSEPNEMSDIYSLGVLFVEMLNGGLSLEQRSNLSSVIQDMEQYTWEAEGFKVSGNLKRLLNKMVRHNRAERYQTAKDVLDDLKEELRVIRSQEILSNVRVLEKENELAMLNRMDADTQLVQLKKEIDMAKLLKKKMIVKGQCTKRLSDQIATLSIKAKRKLRLGKALQRGDILDGRFELIAFIKSGGFGSVWKGIDLNREELVAIKILHHQFSADLTRRERFFRGARKMMQLKHAHIVQVILEEGFHDGIFYFVMEYCSGGDLQEAIHSETLRPTERLKILSQISDALIYAHSEGVIHRDVKPGNILLDANKNAKLTDFDLVHVLDETGGTRTGALGTFIFSAPETMENAKVATPASDMYGLAMSAVFCLSNRSLSVDILRDPARYFQGMSAPENLKNAMQTAISFNKEERTIDLSQLKQELDSAHGKSMSQQASSDKTTNGKAGIFCAVLTLLAFTVILLATQTRSSQTEDRNCANKKDVLENIISNISFDNDIIGSRFLSFSSDGSQIVNMLNEKKLGFWNISDGGLATTYELPTTPRHIESSKNQDYFTYVDETGTIYYGDTKENPKLRNLSKEINWAQVSTPLKRAFFDPKRDLLIVPDIESITVYDLVKQDVSTSPKLTIKSLDIAFAPDAGTLAFVTAGEPNTNETRPHVVVFDYTTKKVASHFAFKRTHFFLDFFTSENNQYISLIGKDNTISSYKTEDGRLLSKIHLPKTQISSIHFIPNSEYFITVSKNQSISRWNFFTGKGPQPIANAKRTSYPMAIAFGPKNQIAWNDTKGKTVIFNYEHRRVAQTIDRHTQNVRLLNNSLKDQGCVTWKNGGLFTQRFNFLSSQGITQYKAMDTFKHLDSEEDVAIEIKKDELLVYKTGTDFPTYTIKPKPGFFFIIKETKKTHGFFAIRQWSKKNKFLISVYNTKSQERVLDFPTEKTPPYRLQHWPNQRSISIKDADSLKFFSLDSGNLEQIMTHRSGIQIHTSAEHHPLLATVSKDNKLSIFKMTNFKPILLFETKIPQGIVETITFSHNGKLLLLSSDHFCSMYDTQSGALISSYEGNFSSGLFTKNGKHAVVTKNQKEIIFYDVATGEIALTFRPLLHKNWFAFTEEGFFTGSDAIIENLFERTLDLPQEEKEFIRLKHNPRVTALALGN